VRKKRATTGGRPVSGSNTANAGARIDPRWAIANESSCQSTVAGGSDERKLAKARYTISKTRAWVGASSCGEVMARGQEGYGREWGEGEREVGRFTGKQCGKINSETREREREKRTRGKWTRNPNVKRQRTVRKLLQGKGKKKKKKDESTIDDSTSMMDERQRGEEGG